MADRRLQVFQAVAHILSFTKAAEVLHMTQPAVTFQIRQLEEHFNTRLFDRVHNRISLTEAGTVVYNYAQRIFELYTEMERSVKEITGGINGVVAIGASTTIAEYMLPKLLGEFKRNYPDVTIHLKVANSEAIISMVDHNTIDLGVVETEIANKKLVVEPCRNDHLVVIMPPNHALANYNKLQFRNILEFPFICREAGSGTREAIGEYVKQSDGCNTGIKVAMELGSPEAVKSAVESGMGISIVSSATIQKELRLQTLIAIPLEPPLIRTFAFVHQKQKFRIRVIKELLEFARRYCAQNKQPYKLTM